MHIFLIFFKILFFIIEKSIQTGSILLLTKFEIKIDSN